MERITSLQTDSFVVGRMVESVNDMLYSIDRSCRNKCFDELSPVKACLIGHSNWPSLWEHVMDLWLALHASAPRPCEENPSSFQLIRPSIQKTGLLSRFPLELATYGVLSCSIPTSLFWSTVLGSNPLRKNSYSCQVHTASIVTIKIVADPIVEPTPNNCLPLCSIGFKLASKSTNAWVG